MSIPDLTDEFATLTELIDLAEELLLDSLTRTHEGENEGYVIPLREGNQICALLNLTREYAVRVQTGAEAASADAFDRYRTKRVAS